MLITLLLIFLLIIISVLGLNLTKTITSQTDDDTTKNVKIMAPFKYLSNFWKTIEMALINCEINLTLTSNKCVI